MKFEKRFLQALVFDDFDTSETEIILIETVGKRRWVNEKRTVFKHEGFFYETFWDQAATEQQEQEPFELEAEMIECHRVEPVEVTVIKFKRCTTQG